MFNDWRGTEIKVGSKVVYAVRVGSSLEVKEAEVFEIIPLNNNPYQYYIDNIDTRMKKDGWDFELNRMMDIYKGMSYKVKVGKKRRHSPFSSWEDPDRVSTLRKLEYMTVVKV